MKIENLWNQFEIELKNEFETLFHAII